VQRFNDILLRNSLPATDCTDWWSYPILYLLFNFLNSLGIICTEGKIIIIIIYRLSAKRPPTLRPNQQTWAVNPPVGCYHLHPQSPFIIITQPEGWYSLYRPTEGRRLSKSRWLASYITRWFTRPQTVTHLSTNRARRGVTTLIETNVLPLSHIQHTTFIRWRNFWWIKM